MKITDEAAPEMLERLGADGAAWAKEFRETALRLGYSDMDEGWLVGWFCNAIENAIIHHPDVKRLTAALPHMGGGSTKVFEHKGRVYFYEWRSDRWRDWWHFIGSQPVASHEPAPTDTQEGSSVAGEVVAYGEMLSGKVETVRIDKSRHCTEPLVLQATLIAERERWRSNSRETFEAMCAMRNSINEHIPMPSLESDLLSGPENSVFLGRVAEAVISSLTAFQQEVERLLTLSADLTMQAKGHAQEARTANNTIYEIYQALSGATGEPGNWRGAEPAREYVRRTNARNAELVKALEPFANGDLDVSHTAVILKTNDRPVQTALDRARAALKGQSNEA